CLLLAVSLGIWICLNRQNRSLYRQIQLLMQKEKDAERQLLGAPEEELSHSMQLFRKLSKLMQGVSSYNFARELFFPAREPIFFARELFFLARELFFFVRERCIISCFVSESFMFGYPNNSCSRCFHKNA
ncbi:MAG: hypothetical protein LBQ73_09130, partial [Tannerellaceae bacterium]|nr:hypothetical protein [Tannerellaceae bacterium]